MMIHAKKAKNAENNKPVSVQDINSIKSALGQNRKVLENIVELAEETQAKYLHSRKIHSFQNALMIINSCVRNNNGPLPYGIHNPIYSIIFLDNQNNLHIATRILLSWMEGYVHPVSVGVENTDMIMAMMTKLTGFQTRIVISSNSGIPCYMCVVDYPAEDDEDEDDEDEV